MLCFLVSTSYPKNMFVTAQLDPCSADYVQGVRMSFRTKEDAVHFAEKQGWDYYV